MMSGPECHNNNNNQHCIELQEWRQVQSTNLPFLLPTSNEEQLIPTSYILFQITPTTGRTKTKGDADPTGPIPPICLQSQAWLTSNYLADPAFPGQGTAPQYCQQGTTFEFEFALFLLLKLTCNCSISPMMTWKNICNQH